MNDLLKLAGELMGLLREAVQDAYKNNKHLGDDDVSEIRTSHIYRYSRYIDALGWDFLVLEEEGHFTGTPIILRSILECLFCQSAIIRNPDYAAERTMYELDDLVKTFNRNGWSLDEDFKKECSELREKLEKEFQIENPKDRKVIQLAKMAGLETLYENYRLLCNSSHPTLRGTISDEKYGSQGWRLSQFGLFVSMATTNLASSVTISDEGALITRVLAVVTEMRRLHEGGKVEELNQVEQEEKEARNNENR